MQPEYIKIFSQMGIALGIDPAFIMTTALRESGWDLPHVYGTNSSSNGKPLNNLFGMTKAGGNNIAYPSLEASAQAWEDNWGKYLANHPATFQEYVQDLLSDPHHMYNKYPEYPGSMADLYRSLVKALNDCGITFTPTSK
jgi:hypothetical protein